MGYKILLVEDEPGLREIIADYFSAQADGCTLDTAAHGRQALEKLDGNPYDLILLDVMLPELDGFTLCRSIRHSSDVPVVFLTARGSEEDTLQGYGLGADDYLTKPFSLPVLYAKVLALIRRDKGLVTSERITAGPLSLDPRSGYAWAGERLLDLPPKEFALLRLLLENPGRLLTRETLLLRVWGYDFDGNDRVVDNHIKNLRRTLGEYANCIKTVIRAGYRLETMK